MASNANASHFRSRAERGRLSALRAGSPRRARPSPLALRARPRDHVTPTRAHSLSALRPEAAGVVDDEDRALR